MVYSTVRVTVLEPLQTRPPSGSLETPQSLGEWKRADTTVLDLIANLLFRCPHRRLTRPITPVSKPGVPCGETYVVCLACGKQFYYDWEKMRLGGPVARDAAKGVLPPELPSPRKSKLKYAMLASAIPVAFLLGKALLKKPPAPKTGDRAPQPDRSARRGK